jgi:peptide/nickel transport system ATP-binding protein
MSGSSPPALEVADLAVELRSGGRTIRAVDGMSLTLEAGETLAIVGESGCGKSVTALAILRLLPQRIATMRASRLRLGGEDLVGLSEEEMRRLRGNRISMVFQEPMTSLNPVLSVGRQIVETIRTHRGLDRAAATAEALDLLRLVRIPDGESRLRQYPFEMSGGMRQRVMIAMAVACRPAVLLADEPTTALDVTVQSQILDLLQDLQRRIGTAMVLITHDLGVVAQSARRVVVMYAGRKVEEAPVGRLFADPRHPYTLGLLASMPRLGSSATPGPRGRLREMSGSVPVMDGRVEGCAFAARCAHALDLCRRSAPEPVEIAPDHRVACWRAQERLEVAHGRV